MSLAVGVVVCSLSWDLLYCIAGKDDSWEGVKDTRADTPVEVKVNYYIMSTIV
jgi:hypothetical protein